jgi:hypothetical protein
MKITFSGEIRDGGFSPSFSCLKEIVPTPLFNYLHRPIGQYA